MPPTLREAILARAEGKPLYAVETVRMLIDRNVLVQDGAGYRLVGEVGELAVPDTLHALLAARLDGLSPEERRLLGDAAVLGKTFTPQALATLGGLEPDRLDELLTAMVRREVLGLQSDPRSPEQGQYTFLRTCSAMSPTRPCRNASVGRSTSRPPSISPPPSGRTR